MTYPNRREFLAQASSLVWGRGLFRAGVATRQASPAVSARLYSEDFPDMLWSFMAKESNALAAEWDPVRSKIRTGVDLEARNRFVREKMIAMLGGLPERTPLDPIVTKVLERPGYRVENLMYQSHPNFWVTGNLYVPASGAGPFPRPAAGRIPGSVVGGFFHPQIRAARARACRLRHEGAWKRTAHSGN